jgi:hypothetical protein
MPVVVSMLTAKRGVENNSNKLAERKTLYDYYRTF